MGVQILLGAGLGALASASAAVLWPSLPWWAVGGVSFLGTLVVLLLPSRFGGFRS